MNNEQTLLNLPAITELDLAALGQFKLGIMVATYPDHRTFVRFAHQAFKHCLMRIGQ